MKKTIKVYGTYREIGYKIGRKFSIKIKKFIHDKYRTISEEFRNNGLIFEKEHYKKLSKKLISSLKKYTPNEYDEICGVSEGANVNIEDVIFTQGYSDIFDVLFKNAPPNRLYADGCTSFISFGEWDKRKKICAGQTWDMPPGTKEYTALIHKNLDDGTEIYSYTTVLGLTHIGVNNSGICIGTANLSTTETGDGVIFPALIQSALSKRNIDSSLNTFKSLPKLSGHYYYLLAPDNKAFGVEVSAFNYHIEAIENGIYAHTNHYKDGKFLKGAVDYSPTSKSREEFMEKFLESKHGKLGVGDCKEILSSHKGGICRHGSENKKIVSVTCGAVIFDVNEKKFYISYGYPCKGQWHKYIIPT